MEENPGIHCIERKMLLVGESDIKWLLCHSLSGSPLEFPMVRFFRELSAYGGSLPFIAAAATHCSRIWPGARPNTFRATLLNIPHQWNCRSAWLSYLCMSQLLVFYIEDSSLE